MRISLRVVVGFLLFFAGVAVLLIMHYGSDLARDIAIRDEAMEVHPTARVVSAKCTRYYFLASACNTEYEDGVPGQPPVTKFQPRHELRFLVFGSVAGQRVVLMRPRSRPDLVTTTAGMAYLGNRVLTLVTLLALCLVTSLGLVARYVRERGTDLPGSETVSSDARSLDEAMTRQIQAQARTRAPTVSGGPSYSRSSSHAAAGTFGRRSS